MKNECYDIIFIAGAPGTGKSSVAQALQKKLKSPCFEFGWIPEFRQKVDATISYQEEEGMAFENLILVIKNYIKHGFKNIILTDLEDKRIITLHKVFKKFTYILITLTVDDAAILKSRVTNAARSSGYRDYKKAIEINNTILNRKLLPKELRINATKKSVKKIVDEITKKL